MVKGFGNDSDSNGSRKNIAMAYLLYVFFGVLSVLITFGNLLVITSIMYFKQLHTPTNFLILSLAVADLLVGVIVLPFSTLLSVTSCWYLTGFLCRVRETFDVLLCTSSIISLSLISVDRYYVVCRPLTYRTKMTIQVTVILILVSWTASVLLAIFATVMHLRQNSSNIKGQIFHSKKSSLLGVALSTHIPAVVIITIYIKILTVALKQARSIHNTASNGSVSKMESKATKTLAIVVLMYLICWYPCFFCMTFYCVSSFTISPRVMEVSKWLGWSNSMFNPFIYGFFYKWFRSAFKIILSGKILEGDFSDAKLS